ncbi:MULTISPECIES: DMT family transporter [unclassified Ruegeria]|uniref:DMT family transporter n=1 Tax=unclassified Ruegeria TaxID=2625375 RepID=UPI001487BB1D|nr:MULTISPECIES: DMT family transporter [unclassified Ruegeria]NOD78060.1 EamA family transporter [Ruegeria sp. HKCCD4332]NOD87644.1 EamA family transporter [Ruegeria sp. HKCCD4318]NOE15677.1 EamA family transporter [Ruegeria sp. HKCCD4318-2]NOG08631.1 DMT family transporter [Ruegeria sp. HKCCD4315]
MNNVNGILLLIGSMAAFALEDMFIKVLSVSVPTGQIMVFLGLVCGVVFAILSLVSRKRIFDPVAWQLLPMVRAATEGVGAVTFVTALSLIDLSTVAAVFQAMPLAVTMGAALFLGEQVGWRRWSAIGVGFIGVLMIIRPGLEGFQPESLFVVLTVIAIAARDLITRKLDVRVASTVVAMQAYIAVALAGGLLMAMSGASFTPLQDGQALPYLGAVGFGVIGYYGIVTAMRVGEASALMPFRYTRLVFSILAGMLMFGERPDVLTMAGATLIIGSGLYTFVRERRLARELVPA